jgi:glycogen synthase
MLAWEFPPRIIGGLAPHVYELSKALVKKGIEVHVATCDFPGAEAYEIVDGVIVHRVDSYSNPTPDFATWVAMMNVNLQREIAETITSNSITLLHAHDWLVANAAIGLKHMFRIPLVATIHSTEYGRRSGVNNDYQRMISSTEGWLTREAWRVICCSKYMAKEINSTLGVSERRIDLVPNGINSALFKTPINLEQHRSRFAQPNEKLILFVGRLVQEKGVSTIVEAAPYLKDLNVKIIIVGEGYLKEELIRRVHELGLPDKVFVTGFLDTETIRGLFRVADVCIIPSIYEPFGIVALEAIAGGSPIVTSGSGGLGEILENDKTAKFVNHDPESLAWGIRKILSDSKYSDYLKKEAYKLVKKYEWGAIATSTIGTYTRTMFEYTEGTWKPF